MRLSLVLAAAGSALKSPFIRTGGKTGRVLKRDVETMLRALPGEGLRGSTRLLVRPSIVASTQQASACITAAAVANADTVTINGTALTATQARASGTVTLATVSAADTVTVNGVVFTAVNGSPVGNQFDMSGTDTADAVTLVTAINACTTVGVFGIIGAKSAAAIVTIYAIAPGTTGNAYTLASSNGGRLAVSGATLANGAAVANNQFDFAGSDILVAGSLATAIAASSTSLISGHCAGSTAQAIVTCATVLSGDFINVAGVRLLARTGTAAVTTGLAPGEFSMNGTDSQDATSLALAINEHPTLSQIVFANAASAVVTIYERAPSLGQTISISSSGSTLAITGSLTALTASAICYIESIIPGIAGNATTIATSNGTRLAITIDSTGRLSRGTSSTYTY